MNTVLCKKENSFGRTVHLLHFLSKDKAGHGRAAPMSASLQQMHAFLVSRLTYFHFKLLFFPLKSLNTSSFHSWLYIYKSQHLWHLHKHKQHFTKRQGAQSFH